MALYRYKALSDRGKKITGVIDADSLSLAKEKLRKEKVLVTKLVTSQHRKQLVLKPQLLLAFTRELQQLLGAGLPLYESLLTIEEKYRRHRAHALFLDICDRLKGGDRLSTILAFYPKSFDSIYISMVQAGEKTGTLAWSFKQLYGLIERKQKLKKQLLSAMAYPAFLGGFCFFVVLGLLLFVVPSMQELFEGRQLHPLTQSVLNMSRFLQVAFFPMLLGLAVLVMGGVVYFRRTNGKKLVQKSLQKIPLIRTILSEAALIRFCRSSAILLKGGVPLINALSISKNVTRHVLLEEAIGHAESQLIEGYTLSSQLKEFVCVPTLVTRMLAIGEETGKMSDMFQSLSDIYDDELERSLGLITTFLQPALLIILGGVVGLVILSILLPLTDVSSLISN